MYACMHVWGRMDGWLDGWVGEWMDGWWVCGLMGGWMNGWLVSLGLVGFGWMDLMDGWMDLMDGLADRWMDENILYSATKNIGGAFHWSDGGRVRQIL